MEFVSPAWKIWYCSLWNYAFEGFYKSLQFWLNFWGRFYPSFEEVDHT